MKNTPLFNGLSLHEYLEHTSYSVDMGLNDDPLRPVVYGEWTTNHCPLCGEFWKDVIQQHVNVQTPCSCPLTYTMEKQDDKWIKVTFKHKLK